MKRISSADQRQYLSRALKAADWFVHSQLGSYRPKWNADRGRYLYYYFIPGKKHVPGINWTNGRGLFVTAEAYKISRKRSYLDSAELGARYLLAQQVYDPCFLRAFGAFRENTPQDDWGGALDGAQAASGLLMLHKVTGNKTYLRHARAFCDYVLRNFRPGKQGFASGVRLWPEEKIEYLAERHTIHPCIAMPLWHLFRITGECSLLKPVVWAVDAMMRSQQPDGGFWCERDVSKLPLPKPNQHTGRGKGKERYLLRNDDGMVTLFLAAYKITGIRKYLDSMTAYAEWIMANGPQERPFCGFPLQASNLLDIGKVAKKDFSPWVMDNLKKHLLDLQVLGSKDPCAEGGFRGEDEENEGGIFGGRSLDYVTTRTTCYAAGTLFRLSGRGTGAGFSVFGL